MKSTKHYGIMTVNHGLSKANFEAFNVIFVDDLEKIVGVFSKDNREEFESSENIVIGLSVTSPVMNMFSIIFGYSQPIVPSTSFARFVLMMFMIFCLIMRSIYQGSLYKFLQADGTNQQIKSFDDLITRHYKFYIGKSYTQLIEQQRNIQDV